MHAATAAEGAPSFLDTPGNSTTLTVKSRAEYAAAMRAMQAQWVLGAAAQRRKVAISLGDEAAHHTRSANNESEVFIEKEEVDCIKCASLEASLASQTLCVKALRADLKRRDANVRTLEEKVATVSKDRQTSSPPSTSPPPSSSQDASAHLLQSQLSSLTASLTSSSRQNSLLEARVASLESSLESERVCRSDLQLDFALAQENITSQEHKFKELHSLLDSERARADSAEERLVDMSKVVSALESELSEASRTVQETRELVMSVLEEARRTDVAVPPGQDSPLHLLVQKHLTVHVTELARVQSELNLTHESHSYTRATLTDTQRELINAQAQHKEIVQSLALLDREKVALITQASELADSNAVLHRTAQSCTAQRDALRRRAEEAEDELEAARAMVEELSALVKGHEGRIAADELSRNRELEEKDAVDLRLKDVLGERDALASHVEAVTLERDALLSEVVAMTAERDKQSIATSNVRESVVADMKSVAAERDALSAKVHELASQIEPILKDHAAFTSKLEGLAVERDHHAMAFKSLKVDHDAVFTKLETITNDRDHLLSTLESTQAEHLVTLESLTSERDELYHRHTLALQEFAQLKEALIESNEAIELLDREMNTNPSDAVINLQESLASRESELQAKSETVQQLQRALVSLEHSSARSLEFEKAQVDRLQSEIGSLVERAESLARDLIAREEKILALSTEVTTLKATLHQQQQAALRQLTSPKHTRSLYLAESPTVSLSSSLNASANDDMEGLKRAHFNKEMNWLGQLVSVQQQSIETIDSLRAQLQAEVSAGNGLKTLVRDMQAEAAGKDMQARLAVEEAVRGWRRRMLEVRTMLGLVLAGMNGEKMGIDGCHFCEHLKERVSKLELILEEERLSSAKRYADLMAELDSLA
ncbi:hypothetical protein BC830DRAFT_1168706 [Chytriomyces sp. MP71]|nr:hypothetical protein BC830DRAFT_1168706 [Chytriomyces sp. MP71]